MRNLEGRVISKHIVATQKKSCSKDSFSSKTRNLNVRVLVALGFRLGILTENLKRKCKIKKVSFVKVVFYCFHNNRNNRALTLIFSHLLTENLFIDTSVKFWAKTIQIEFYMNFQRLVIPCVPYLWRHNTSKYKKNLVKYRRKFPKNMPYLWKPVTSDLSKST